MFAVLKIQGFFFFLTLSLINAYKSLISLKRGSRWVYTHVSGCNES